jgi:hypothetical protein
MKVEEDRQISVHNQSVKSRQWTPLDLGGVGSGGLPLRHNSIFEFRSSQFVVRACVWGRPLT